MVFKSLCFLSLIFTVSANAQLYPNRYIVAVPDHVLQGTSNFKLVSIGDERMSQIFQTLPPSKHCQVSVVASHGYFYVTAARGEQTVSFVIPKQQNFIQLSAREGQFYFISADAPAKPVPGDTRLAVGLVHRDSWADLYVYRHTFMTFETGTIVQSKTTNLWSEPHVQRYFRDDDTREPIFSCSFSRHSI